MSTLGTVVARNCSPRWPLPTPAMSLAVKKGFFNLYYLQQQQLASSLLTPGGSMALAHPFLCEHDTTCTGASWGQGCVEILQKDSRTNVEKVEFYILLKSRWRNDFNFAQLCKFHFTKAFLKMLQFMKGFS